MESVIPASYEDLLQHTKSYGNYNLPPAEELLNKLGYKSLSLNVHLPVFFVLDYTRQAYLYVDSTCKDLLGYDKDYFMQTGPAHYVTLFHRSDYKIINEQIFPLILKFLKQQQEKDCTSFSFSFNYRIKEKNGEYCTVLQRSCFYINPADGIPQGEVGFIIDISHFKEDTKMLFTIEKIDQHFNTLSKVPLYRAVYFPDKSNDVLSKREVEVLQCIHEGLSSKQIADKLFISINTINNHRKKMLEKTRCSNTADLLHYAVKHGIL